MNTFNINKVFLLTISNIKSFNNNSLFLNAKYNYYSNLLFYSGMLIKFYFV